jgi:hypothetical protein
MGDLAARLGRLTPEERTLLEKRLSAKAARPVQGIPRRRPEEVAPLSFSQRRIWYLEQLNPGTATYNAPNAFRGQGKLDLDAFRRAVNLVVGRHTVLRTLIGTSETGEPLSRLVSEWDAVEVVAAECEPEALRLAEESAKKPFDISRDLMLRALVVLFGEDEFILAFTTHHVAWDGVSKAVFFRELGVLYDAIATGQEPVLLEPVIQYADYALWQQKTFAGARRDKEIAYWKNQLAGAPAYLDIPLDKPRPAVQRFRGAKIPFTLPMELLAGALTLSRAERTTLYTTMLAAYNVFLLAFTGQEDILVATPFAGRDEPETQGLIGFFINTVVVRIRLNTGLTFLDVIRRARESVLGAQDHQLTPMDELMEVLQFPRDLSRMPIAQVNFRLQGDKVPTLNVRGVNLLMLPLIDTSISKFDMALEVASAPGEAGYVEYNTDLFNDERMGRIPKAFGDLLGELVADPDKAVGQLPTYEAIADLRPKRRRIGLGINPSSARNISNG